MTRRLLWVALAVLAAYAVFIGGAWQGIYQPRLRLASVLLAASVLGAWFVVAVRDASWRPRSVLMPAIAACLASLAISTGFSRFPEISLEYLAYAVLLAALYLFLVQLLRREFFRVRVVALCGALFVAIVAVYLVLNAAHWVHWWQVVGRLTIPPLRPEFESLTFGNPATVLTVVALLAMPVVASVSWTTRRGIAAATVLLGSLAAVALVSGSRAGWLGLALAGVVGVAGAALSPSARARIRAGAGGLAGSAGGRVALVSAIGLVAVIVVALAPAILRRVTQGGESNRLAFVRIALDLFAQSPIVGTGPGSWVIQRPALTLPTDPDEYIPHAHNIYAQTLGELGVVGAVAGLVLVVLLARLVIGAIRDPEPARRRMGWATLLGFVYFGAHQALDFYANFPAVLIAAAIPVALLDATAGQPDTAAPRRFQSLARVPMWAGAGAVALAVVLLVGQERAALDQSLAVDLANAGSWAAADVHARAAATADPRIASYAFTAGITAARVGDHDDAVEYFTAVVASNDVPEAWLNLAGEQQQLGLPDQAVESLRKALRLGRQRLAVSIAAGDLALRLGERELAVQTLTGAALAAPSFLADPWWALVPDRRRVLDEVTGAAMAAAGPTTRWEIALMTGDAAKARELTVAPGADPSAIDFVDAWTGDAAAYERLIQRCLDDPLQIHVVWWCARIEGRRGNLDRANEYRYIAYVQIGGGHRGAELRVATRDVAGRTLQGDPAIFWGTYTYRRPTPWDILVPSLVHLTLE